MSIPRKQSSDRKVRRFMAVPVACLMLMAWVAVPVWAACVCCDADAAQSSDVASDNARGESCHPRVEAQPAKSTEPACHGGADDSTARTDDPAMGCGCGSDPVGPAQQKAVPSNSKPLRDLTPIVTDGAAWELEVPANGLHESWAAAEIAGTFSPSSPLFLVCSVLII